MHNNDEKRLFTDYMKRTSKLQSYFTPLNSPLNLHAREEMSAFKDFLLSEKGYHCPISSRTPYRNYMRLLVIIREELIKGRYCRACNELGTMLHNEAFLQNHIRNSILFLLEEYL